MTSLYRQEVDIIVASLLVVWGVVQTPADIMQASVKMHAMSFIEVDIRHRMASLRMLY